MQPRLPYTQYLEDMLVRAKCFVTSRVLLRSMISPTHLVYRFTIHHAVRSKLQVAEAGGALKHGIRISTAQTGEDARPDQHRPQNTFLMSGEVCSNYRPKENHIRT